MNNSIDWYAIQDAVGDDADIEQFVTMPMASRLLLMELATSFYGRYNRSGMAEPTEMYEYLSTAQKALAREEEPMNSIDYAFGTSLVKQFPGLVAYWPMSLTDTTGRCGDASGNGFHLLQSSGVFSLGFDYDVNDVPIAVFLNSGVHLYYPDGNPFDIVAAGALQGLKPGLTLGCWIKKETTESGAQYIFDKAGTNSYVLLFGSNSRQVQWLVNGATILAGPSLSSDWNHIVARFVPGVSLSIFVNGDETTATTAITSIPNSAGTFRLGGNNLSGLMSQAFISMSAVPDSHILRYYNQTKAIFNG